MRRKIFSIIIIMVILLCILTITSNASMQIKAGQSAQTDINVSDSYAYCYNLRANSSTLGNNTLDPHLTTNADWAACAYLAASVYGTNMNTTAVNSFQTSGNNSGVMDFGKTHTVTASFLYNTVSNENTVNIYNNADTKYVESINGSDSLIGKAMKETLDWQASTIRGSAGSPIGVRKGLFCVYIGTSVYGTSGSAHSSATFRPVIWN